MRPINNSLFIQLLEVWAMTHASKLVRIVDSFVLLVLNFICILIELRRKNLLSTHTHTHYENWKEIKPRDSLGPATVRLVRTQRKHRLCYSTTVQVVSIHSSRHHIARQFSGTGHRIRRPRSNYFLTVLHRWHLVLYSAMQSIVSWKLNWSFDLLGWDGRELTNVHVSVAGSYRSTVSVRDTAGLLAGQSCPPSAYKKPLATLTPTPPRLRFIGARSVHLFVCGS